VEHALLALDRLAMSEEISDDPEAVDLADRVAGESVIPDDDRQVVEDLATVGELHRDERQDQRLLPIV
jgi:hypothetical protein